MTTGIALLSIETITSVGRHYYGIGWMGLFAERKLILELFSFKNMDSPYLYGAFFTSIWVWLYVLSIFTIKLAHKVRPLWLKLLQYLDIEKKPMQAIGRIAGLMAGMGYALILALVWVSHHWR
jgi:hypothetical protein